MSKLAVVGSRSFNNYELLEEEIDKLSSETKIAQIISGGAKGADTLGEMYASKHDIPITIYKPDWKKNPRGAGLLRNMHIVNSSDMMIAFWNHKSPGTKHSIECAQKKGIPVKIVPF